MKGSVNGIYHTPSSRYYSRTKNVTKMFCSVEEAERAGYRAPKQ
ncbi:sunset domain-containing protein [Bacillus sp. 4A_MP2]